MQEGRALTIEKDGRRCLRPTSPQRGKNSLEGPHIEVGDVRNLVVVQKVDALHSYWGVQLLQQLPGGPLPGKNVPPPRGAGAGQRHGQQGKEQKCMEASE